MRSWKKPCPTHSSGLGPRERCFQLAYITANWGVWLCNPQVCISWCTHFALQLATLTHSISMQLWCQILQHCHTGASSNAQDGGHRSQWFLVRSIWKNLLWHQSVQSPCPTCYWRQESLKTVHACEQRIRQDVHTSFTPLVLSARVVWQMKPLSSTKNLPRAWLWSGITPTALPCLGYAADWHSLLWSAIQCIRAGIPVHCKLWPCNQVTTTHQLGQLRA